MRKRLAFLAGAAAGFAVFAAMGFSQPPEVVHATEYVPYEEYYQMLNDAVTELIDVCEVCYVGEMIQRGELDPRIGEVIHR